MKQEIDKEQICSSFNILQDYVTDNEIEFYEDDVIEQYEMNVIPLLYMDFVFDEKIMYYNCSINL